VSRTDDVGAVSRLNGKGQAATLDADGHTALVRYDGVSMTYPSRRGRPPLKALEPVNLTVDRGEFICLVGPSGCGKTTLLKLTAALLTPTQGSVVFKGAALTEPNRSIGVMFQKPVLLPWRTVEKNIFLPAEIAGTMGPDTADRVAKVLSMVGLHDFATALPDQLSGGMQQRAALARTLVYEPELLLMDEPFGALDEFTREAMNLELSELTSQSGITSLFVTHNIPEAVFLADRVIVMSPRPGRVSGVVEVPFPKPRTVDFMRDPKFTDLTFEVRSILAEAEDKSGKAKETTK
jgi:NitT/TauT family transport system ATP-binding protein